jgi:hypothetical protein
MAFGVDELPAPDEPAGTLPKSAEAPLVMGIGDWAAGSKLDDAMSSKRDVAASSLRRRSAMDGV